MADSKSRYSDAARDYEAHYSHSSMLDAMRYYRSKVRESKFNENWKKHMVNLNDVVAMFAPNSKGKMKGVKYVFSGPRYDVKVDMPAGYLRIYDKVIKKYVKLDGNEGTLEETHFKVKKRREM